MMLGAWELVVVAIAALLFLGPEKLPELARTLARLMAQVQGLVGEARRSVNDALHEDDVPRRSALPVGEEPLAQTPSAPPHEGAPGQSAPPPVAAAPFSAWVEREQQRLTQDPLAPASNTAPEPRANADAAADRVMAPSVAALTGDKDS